MIPGLQFDLQARLELLARNIPFDILFCFSRCIVHRAQWQRKKCVSFHLFCKIPISSSRKKMREKKKTKKKEKKTLPIVHNADCTSPGELANSKRCEV